MNQSLNLLKRLNNEHFGKIPKPEFKKVNILKYILQYI